MTDTRFGDHPSKRLPAPRLVDDRRRCVAMTAQRNQNPSFVAIVDDDDLMRGALQGLLNEAGFVTRTFSSAEEFLKAADRAQTACLIADLPLPRMSPLHLHHLLP